MTENTFDSYLWQILENKQKFISQIMTSKSPVRACEDVDDTALSYAEVKALATGNPYIKEKMSLDMEVSKLKLMKANYNSQKYRLEEQIARSYPARIKSLEERIAGLSEDASAAVVILDKDKQKEEFSIEIQRLIYTDKKQAGIALMAACTGLAVSKNEEMVAAFHGFNLSAYFESFSQKFILTVRRRCSYPMEMGSDPLGNIQRITNLMAGIEKSLLETKQKLESVKQQFATAQKEVLKPFAKEEELKEKIARLAELDALLNLDDQGITEVFDTENDGQEDVENDGQRDVENDREKSEDISEQEGPVFNKSSQVISDKDKEEEPIPEIVQAQQGKPDGMDEKAEIPRRESETAKIFDGTTTVPDENKGIPVEAAESVDKSQIAGQEQRRLTLNDLKQMQRKYAEKRTDRQNLTRENPARRDGYSR